MRRRKKLILKKWIKIIILIIFLAIFIFSIFKIFKWKQDQNKIKEIENNLIKPIEKTADENNSELINPPDDKDNDYWNYIKMDMLNVDFNELNKKNSDTIGWVKVQGTNINYPVVQTSNNEYYLDHSYDKTKNEAGWVFADYRNDFNNFDKNTVIYAHGRLDTTMFGSLKNILDSSWYDNKNNHVVKFSTPNENTLWQVFSVYTIKAESYYITTKFSSDKNFKDFINTLKSRSKVQFSAEVNEKDKILTLSTCKDNNGNRVVMHAKLIKIENR
ncbi:MAG: class B sortase [Bacilli bacterium]